MEGEINISQVMGMYPPEWWWAERQVSEVLAENPGELVKTGGNMKFLLNCFN